MAKVEPATEQFSETFNLNDKVNLSSVSSTKLSATLNVRILEDALYAAVTPEGRLEVPPYSTLPGNV